MHTLMMMALMLAAAPLAAQQRDAAAPVPDTIVTSGEAMIRRAPDRAFVTVTVEARAKNPRDAQRLNAEAMTAVHQRLTQARVPKEALRTLGYDLEQEFDFPGGRRVLREFVARNAVEVRVDDIARVGEVLDVAVQGGATAISGVRFELQDREKVEREALRLAVADARSRADAAAAGAGRSIDRVVKIEDVREGGVISMGRPMMAMKAEAAQTPVEPGLVEIRARVTLTASMK
jgi:uncharacterized protein YggE